MQFIMDYIQFVWLGLAVILIIIEAATFNLTTIWFALGALISMVLAFIKMPISWQILLFLIISSILLFFTRPVAVKKLKIGSVKTNSEGLIGQTALVTAEMGPNSKGQAKIKGQIWTASPVDDETIDEGTEVVVEKIEGVTLQVRRK